MDLWTVPPRRRVCPPSHSLIPIKFCRPIMSENLPLHIIQIILSKLSISQFPLCRLVCKDWNSLVSALSSNSFLVFSEFYKLTCSRCFSLHSVEYTSTPSQSINFSAFFHFHPDLSDVSIVGFCNGLLCITKPVNGAKNCAVVINPMTNEYFKLPGWEDMGEATMPSGLLYGYSRFYSYGLGFIPKTKQYKIARITQPKPYGELCSLETFTFGKSTEWSRIRSMPLTIHAHGVYFDGGLYWVGTNQERENVIYRLNLEDDRFEAVFWKREFRKVSIGTFNGGLYATAAISRGGDDEFEVWKMGSDSWMREFAVSMPRDCMLKWSTQLQLIQACEDGSILCLVHHSFFALYNPKTGTMRVLDQTGSDVNRNFMNVLSVHHIGGLKFDSLKEIFAGNTIDS